WRQESDEKMRKTIMEQFNPCLRNFVAMGKNYEKALASVTFAAKGYFDALVRMGELASESQGSKDLGDVLFQMAEVHRQIQVQLEEMVGIQDICSCSFSPCASWRKGIPPNSAFHKM
uniref:IMD domain-containing protein n=1 Tax=Periophthalmus magnuspinnatus TaxID=409849 RepID=A0A3B3ZV26_9GOBI